MMVAAGHIIVPNILLIAAVVNVYGCYAIAIAIAVPTAAGDGSGSSGGGRCMQWHHTIFLVGLAIAASAALAAAATSTTAASRHCHFDFSHIWHAAVVEIALGAATDTGAPPAAVVLTRHFCALCLSATATTTTT
jgi:hypothetical protein